MSKLAANLTDQVDRGARYLVAFASRQIHLIADIECPTDVAISVRYSVHSKEHNTADVGEIFFHAYLNFSM